MMTSRVAAALVALVLADVPVAAQECGAPGALSSATGVAATERRRDAAATYLGVVHAAQGRAHAAGGRYLPLHELPNLPAAPLGFIPRLIAGQWSYAISLKDLFDACGFALFSDEQGTVYEAVPRRIHAVPPRPPGNALEAGTVSGTLVPSTGTVGPFTGAAGLDILKTP